MNLGEYCKCDQMVIPILVAVKEMICLLEHISTQMIDCFYQLSVASTMEVTDLPLSQWVRVPQHVSVPFVSLKPLRVMPSLL